MYRTSQKYPSIRRHLRCAGVLLLALLAVDAHAADPRDPWENLNRRVFAFNDFLDRYFLVPVAKGYQAVTPEAVDKGVTHVFANLKDVVNSANFALQIEGGMAVDSASRVLVNTTLGIGGWFDVASAGGIPHRDTGFGTTLGKWGVGSGNYLVLPFWGPSTVREALAIPVNRTLHPVDRPLTMVESDGARLALGALELVDMRADLLRYEQAIVGDRYSFLRDIYLQRREFDVQGGNNPGSDPFLDDDFDDFEDDTMDADAAEKDPEGADDEAATEAELPEAVDPERVD